MQVNYFRQMHLRLHLFQNLYQQNNGLGSLQGNQLTETGQKRHFYNIFSQLRTLLSEQFEIQAGLNYNKTKFDLNNYTENINQEYSYDGIFSPQISFLFKPNSLKTLYF